jgi:hypothetical protein
LKGLRVAVEGQEVLSHDDTFPKGVLRAGSGFVVLKRKNRLAAVRWFPFTASEPYLFVRGSIRNVNSNMSFRVPLFRNSYLYTLFHADFAKMATRAA